MTNDSAVNTAAAVATAFNILAPLAAEIILDLRSGRDPEELRKITDRVRKRVEKNRKRNRELREEITGTAAGGSGDADE